MTDHVKTISKEVYDRAMANNGYITGSDERKIFSDAELWGYGVYRPKAMEKEGQYYCTYSLGSNCD